jgi:hypothetical protein
MESPKIVDYTNRTPALDNESGSGKTSTVRRIALVAVLAGFAFVAVATINKPASDQLPAGDARTTDVSTQGTMNDTEVQAATSVSEYYFPSQHVNQAKSTDGNVMTYEHD